MGTALIKIKIMPKSPKTDLDEIQKKAEKVIKNENGKNPKFEREPIAFGLTALITSFAIDETNSTSIFEEKLTEIPNVSSAEIIDFRRALW